MYAFIYIYITICNSIWSRLPFVKIRRDLLFYDEICGLKDLQMYYKAKLKHYGKTFF